MGNRVTLTKTVFTAERHSCRNRGKDGAILFVSEYDKDAAVLFVSEHDEDAPERYRSIYIDVGLDTELGSPDTITISIQPGDKLND